MPATLGSGAAYPGSGAVFTKGNAMNQVHRIVQPPTHVAKVMLLRGVVLGPGQIGSPGEIYELPKHLATQLVTTGQAEYTDAGDPAEGYDPGADAHRAGYSTVTVEGATDRDPKPKRKG